MQTTHKPAEDQLAVFHPFGKDGNHFQRREVYIIYAGKSNTNVIGFVRYIYICICFYIYMYIFKHICVCVYIYMLENKDNTVVFFLSGGGWKGRKNVYYRLKVGFKF